MTVDDAIKIVTCCEFDHGTPGERALLAEARMVICEANDRQFQALREMPYAEYLKTDHWKKVSAKAVARARFACQVCNSKDFLQVHHRTYERRGNEDDADLTCLCRTCHELFHSKTVKSRNCFVCSGCGKDVEEGGRANEAGEFFHEECYRE